jgi:hypothetical protein
MLSPFPGMDPYLEWHWGDVHASIVVYARDQLQPVLPKSLVARVEERLAVESAPSSRRTLVPDVRIVQRRRGKKSGAKTNGAVALALAVAEPLVIELDEPATEGFIEIRERDSENRLITVIEVLSLTNKTAGPGQRQYLQKREELQQASVSIVEVDLLRSGERLLPCPLECLPESRRTPYLACVQRGWTPTRVEVYPIALQERLPAIKIPLRETDADVPLDLQPLIERCYRGGGYDTIDYRKDPVPPLTGSDARWAAARLRRKGFRRSRR